ncbi:hypothetical protein PYW08_011852 [Mythimna loreyi]|uniref:Uncharacterized protein n=1 Tax=Mythimna loreyi TaxID=667449 RepID=A0ACC2QMP9_9NEOP|nr:hypothetical protein PYW08_011852 [Mythimna loreyi]
MGIIWRSTMPLLTTLAALVIIVHSAEEDMETEYRHDLRPRVLDTGTPNFDQPWRAMEADPPVQEQRNTENWEKNISEEIPKRRRPGRKRKRRPQADFDEPLTPQERFVYPEEPHRPFFELDIENSHQTTEMPKRRRKKPENRPIRWTDDVVDLGRPVRRRGQRRKRPSLETWPELSDFTETTQEPVETKTESIHRVNVEDVREEIPQDVVLYEDKHQLAEQIPTNLKIDLHQRASNTESLQINDPEINIEHKTVEDVSLSESSSEVFNKSAHKRSSPTNNTSNAYAEFKKAQNSHLMDPLTLKDILKRSNGTSLSEILQQHNLSLTDLLHGKHHAVSIFKPHDSLQDKNRNPSEPRNDISEVRHDIQGKESEEQSFINLETNYATEPAVEYPTPVEIQTEDDIKDVEIITEDNIRDIESTTTVKPEETSPKMLTRPRFAIGARKKLRMRPMLNNTYKGQLSRDLVTLNSRKYSHHRRNMTKAKEWKDVIPSMVQNNTHVDKNNSVEHETTTMAFNSEETTITIKISQNNTSSEEINLEFEDPHGKLDDINMDQAETTINSIKDITTETPKPATEKPTVMTMVRPTANSSGLRRQAFNNRLKRKRLKHKNATTEPPQDDLIKHLLGLGSLVSSSEFIAKTPHPRPTEDDATDSTALEDFITTESTRKTESNPEQSTVKVTKFVPIIPSATEESAKIEIEEILNDTRTSAKLSKILMERNMTLNELVEHRERGSSHVHLADIFHNASREPNPPEPFLSKSLLEPISKETYPLRALLDANLHDPRVTTDEPSMINNVNIPVVMDFRNNVNENAENMGIMSLFNNFTKSANGSALLEDSEGRAYKTSILSVTITNETNANETNTSETVRESRVLSESPDDIVSWNEIFSLMGRNHNNDSSSGNIEGQPLKPFKTISLDEDTDGDGLIVLEDLQHLKEFENNIASGSEEKIEVNTYENKPPASGILDKIPSQTKSVTVATASIAGLAMILFLLTYAAFKWKQQRSTIRKKRSFGDERIPTPVFENRKGHKNNCSTRSISPMLQTSNIYTLNTLDSRNGKESPDYMWDSLRKPFQ